MKIEQVKIKQFKCHTDLEVDLAGKSIILVGENGVGKSSLIQFINIALGKPNSAPPYFEGTGQVVATKDGRKMLFKVYHLDGKPKLTVETSDGLKSTQKGVIADITGAMDFDIDKFVELSKTDAGKKEQIKIFKSFLPKEIQAIIDQLRIEHDILFDERTQCSRLVKHVDGAIETMKGGLPCDEPESTEELSKRLGAAIENNHQVRKAINLRETLVTQLKDIQDKLSALPLLTNADLIPTQELENDIKQADEKRKNYNDYRNFLAKEDELKVLRKQHLELTAKIEEKRSAMSDAVINCESPVEGLTLTDDGLFYLGRPVDALTMSTSEIMELGFRLKLAENKELGILFVERGESLGKEKLAALFSLAEKYNQQLILEEVRRGEEKLKIEFIGE